MRMAEIGVKKLRLPFERLGKKVFDTSDQNLEFASQRRDSQASNTKTSPGQQSSSRIFRRPLLSRPDFDRLCGSTGRLHGDDFSEDRWRGRQSLAQSAFGSSQVGLPFRSRATDDLTLPQQQALTIGQIGHNIVLPGGAALCWPLGSLQPQPPQTQPAQAARRRAQARQSARARGGPGLTASQQQADYSAFAARLESLSQPPQMEEPDAEGGRWRSSQVGGVGKPPGRLQTADSMQDTVPSPAVGSGLVVHKGLTNELEKVLEVESKICLTDLAHKSHDSLVIIDTSARQSFGQGQDISTHFGQQEGTSFPSPIRAERTRKLPSKKPLITIITPDF